MNAEKRCNAVTLVSRSLGSARDWNTSCAGHRIVSTDNPALLSDALRHAVSGETEVHRLIIDGSMQVEKFLSLLADVPVSFTGDIVFIDGDHAYLSSATRGAGRIFYRMSSIDIDFYLAAHNLIGRPAMPAVSLVRPVVKYGAWQKKMRMSRPQLRLVHAR